MEEKKKKQDTLTEKQKNLQELHRELLLFRGELNDLEKTLSRLNNESIKLYEDIEDMLSG